MFDATCAFSRVAIALNDPVLLVAIAPSFPVSWNTCDLVNAIAGAEIKGQQISSFFRRVGLGTYNGYGSISGFDPDEGMESGFGCSRLFMVHLYVANGLLGRKYERLADACELIKIAYDLRVPLNMGVLGGQFAMEYELTGQAHLLELSSRILKQQRSRLQAKQKLFGG